MLIDFRTVLDALFDLRYCKFIFTYVMEGPLKISTAEGTPS